MKKIIGTIFITLAFLSCKKENEELPLRCGTIFHQSSWAKNFSPDSLYDISNIVFVMYKSQLPSSQAQDTSYSTLVPVQFMPNGSGILNNSSSFTYRIVLTENNPEIYISDLNDISSIFPFANTFLSQQALKFSVESYLNTGGQFRFTNGVEYPLTTQKYEGSYLSFKRN